MPLKTKADLEQYREKLSDSERAEISALFDQIDAKESEITKFKKSSSDMDEVAKRNKDLEKLVQEKETLSKSLQEKLDKLTITAPPPPAPDNSGMGAFAPIGDIVSGFFK